MTEEQRSPEEICEDIEETRERLGDTAAAVAQKTDVKQQAKAKVSGVKEAALAIGGALLPDLPSESSVALALRSQAHQGPSLRALG